MNKDFRKVLAFPYIIWMVGFTIIPLSLIFIYGLTDKSGSFTFANVLAIFAGEHFKALILSISLSVVSTVICLIMAFPLALTLKSKKLDKGSLIVFIFILPMWMNSLLRTMSWMVLLEKNGLINSLLQTLSLPKIHVINTPLAVIIGMIYDFLPFMILPIYNSLCKIQQNTIEAAWDLGADGFKTFTKIIFPLSFPGVISGISMVFIPTLTTFAISDLLGGGKILLLGNLIEQQFKQLNDKNTGSALSFILMIFIFLTITVTSKANRNMEDSIL